MDLVRDLLDKEVLDRHGREVGRVDGIVMEVRGTAAPQVAAIEIGPAVLAYRIRPLFGRWIAALEYGLGVDEGRPLRIPFDEILEITDRVKIDRAYGETPAAPFERKLRRLMRFFPGA